MSICGRHKWTPLVDLPEGAFTNQLLGSRVTFTVTPLMFASAMVQYNASGNVVAANVRLRWEYRPDTLPTGFPALVNRAVVVKVTRLFRLCGQSKAGREPDRQGCAQGQKAAPMNIRRSIAICAWVAWLPLAGNDRPRAAQNPAQDHAGQYARSDIVYGSRLYAAQCATCHGADGAGVGTVNLRGGQFRRATTDQELQRLIATGIPGSAMPPFKFDAAELASLVAFIRSMNTFDAAAVKVGDPGRGRAVFEGRGGCLKCHMVNDRGSALAPDLSDIGANRAPGTLERHLIDPTGSMMPINRPIRAITRSGKVHTGRRLNEDTYSVQLIDDQERLVSLLKTDLRELQILAKSTMPSYKETLAPDELADLVAYLVSLKGS